MTDTTRIVSVEREIAAPADGIFELIADPSQQPRWDGNDNLSEAAPGQRVHQVGDSFIMMNTSQTQRRNHIVEFTEGRLIAWLPSPMDADPPGHLWRWELEPIDDNHTLVRHTYDWTNLTDEKRLPRAQGTTEASLRASIDRLATLAEQN